MALRLFFALAAAALLLCCSQFEFDNPYDPDNWKSSSGRSMIVQSSSSLRQSSSSRLSSSSFSYSSSSSLRQSSSSSVVYSDKGNNIASYRTVQIGSQTWMAENLDYDVAGSKCYDDDPANCVKYGRLYDWATAMNLPSYCNSSTCTSLVQAGHRGICPSGWHIPSIQEWSYLENYVGGSSVADKHLKATSGWNDYNGQSGNGLDTYGFAALPGGFSLSHSAYSGFSNVGFDGLWWSTEDGGTDFAWGHYMGNVFQGNNTGLSGNFKADLFSVRCVRDDSMLPSSSSSSSGCTAANNTSTQYCSNGVMKTYGSVTYSSQTYKTVVIGTQNWMAENLNYNASGSVCYDNSTANCTKYGRLYDWATAMDLPSSCNSNSCAGQVSAKHKGICPNGWHIPSYDDWETLIDYVGGSSVAGKHLKAASGWYNCGVSGNTYSCLDTYGFAASPGGYSDPDGDFGAAGDGGYWWSSFEDNANLAYNRFMSYHNESGPPRGSNVSKTYLWSVRCVED